VNPATRICPLGDGRRLAFTEWGAPGGVPVLYCHGFPASRLEARLGDATARALGIRLIAPDRPGFGASDPSAGRRLGDWPGDLASLADHLGLARFHLLGVSGGGPYALACALALRDRLLGVSIVCGLGELAGSDAVGAMGWPERLGVRFCQNLPGLADWVYGRLAGPLFRAHPESIFRLMTSQLPAADHAVLGEPATRASILSSFSEAFRQGGEGAAQELGIYTRPWDIDPTRIGLPVQLWHGEQDSIVPVAMGRAHAAALPACSAHFLPEEGHFSLVVRHMEPILRQLIAA
jgi:pimeloyl-ACP methyl ester carboxylesterase